MYTAMVFVSATGPPEGPKRLPRQVIFPLGQAFQWFLWFGVIFSIASFVATVMILTWQRRSSASIHLLEEATLIRILIASAVLGSALEIADRLIPT